MIPFFTVVHKPLVVTGAASPHHNSLNPPVHFSHHQPLYKRRILHCEPPPACTFAHWRNIWAGTEIYCCWFRAISNSVFSLAEIHLKCQSGCRTVMVARRTALWANCCCLPAAATTLPSLRPEWNGMGEAGEDGKLPSRMDHAPLRLLQYSVVLFSSKIFSGIIFLTRPYFNFIRVEEMTSSGKIFWRCVPCQLCQVGLLVSSQYLEKKFFCLKLIIWILAGSSGWWYKEYAQAWL